jgi:uncharacterized protein (TIGR00369 family)
MATATADSTRWEVRDPEYRDVVRNAFEAQKAMALIGATLVAVEPGFVEIELPVNEMLMSHIPNIVHGGTVGMIADSALGFAALTLAEPGAVGVTAEYKINMLSPAVGESLSARGEVVKPGKQITVARADVLVRAAGREKIVATALATLVALTP